MYTPDAPRLRPENADSDLSWMEQGLCRPDGPGWVLAHANSNGFDTISAMMFPERGEATRPGQHVCEKCPVEIQCREYALAEPAIQGIWGGTTGRERTRLRVQGPRRKPPHKHGTEGGFQRHLAENTTPCNMCRGAHRRYKKHGPPPSTL